MLAQFSPVNGKALLTDPNISVIELRASQHRQLHMRTDKEPFTDKRVRQAIALLHQPRQHRQGPARGQVRLRQRQPVRAGLPVDRQVGRPAQAGRREGQGAAVGGRQERPLARAARLERLRDAAVRRSSSRTTSRPRASTSSSTSPTPPATTATRCSASRRGWTPRSASPSTGTAACRTCSSARRSRATAYGTRPTSRTRSTTSSSASTSRRSTCRAQRTAAKKIQEMLLDEVPIIFSYFYFYLTATKSTVAGVDVAAMGHVRRHARRARRPDRARSRERRRATIARFLAKRIALGLVTLLLLSIVIFFAAQVLPGDVGRRVLGPFADQASVDALNKQLGTDRPLITQYWDWITRLRHRRPRRVGAGPAPRQRGPRRSARGFGQARAAGVRHRRPARRSSAAWSRR